MTIDRPQADSALPSPAPAEVTEQLAPRERWVSARGWLLVIAVLVYACAFQGVRPLYSPDEGRYTNIALNMLASGDWLRPMLHPEVEHCRSRH